MREQRTNYTLAVALSDASVEMHKTAELMQAADCRGRSLGQLDISIATVSSVKREGVPGFEFVR